jgi:hypothetical protein
LLFGRLLGAFTAKYGIIVLVSGYQAIDMYYIVLHIYSLVPRNKHFYVVCACERSEKPPLNATGWSGIKNSRPSKEIRLSWYQSID